MSTAFSWSYCLHLNKKIKKKSCMLLEWATKNLKLCKWLACPALMVWLILSDWREHWKKKKIFLLLRTGSQLFCMTLNWRLTTYGCSMSHEVSYWPEFHMQNYFISSSTINNFSGLKGHRLNAEVSMENVCKPVHALDWENARMQGISQDLWIVGTKSPSVHCMHSYKDPTP